MRDTTLLAPLVVACAVGGDGGDGTTDPQNLEPVTVSLSPTTLNVGLGQTRTVAVSVTRPEFRSGAGTVTLGVDNLPAGVTATFEPSAVTGRTASSTLTIAVAPDAKPGRTDLFITLTGAGFAGGEPPSVELTMVAPQVNVTRAGPGSGTVTSSPAGINCGASCTASFSATPPTLTATPTAGSTFAGWSGACVATTTTCTFTPTVTGSSPANNVTATFTAPSFFLRLAPTSISLPQGTNGTVTVSIMRVGGFTGAVNLAFAGVPSGLTITPNPTSITGDSASVTIAAALSLGAGNFPITINGTAAGVAPRSLNVARSGDGVTRRQRESHVELRELRSDAGPHLVRCAE